MNGMQLATLLEGEGKRGEHEMRVLRLSVRCNRLHRIDWLGLSIRKFDTERMTKVC